MSLGSLVFFANFPNFPNFLKFSVLRSKTPRTIRAPRRRSGQIALPAMTTKSPFAKGGFRGNVNIFLLYYVAVNFRLSVTYGVGVAGNRANCKLSLQS